MHGIEVKHSFFLKWIWQIITAAIISVCLFLALNLAGERWIEKYLENSNYVEKQNTEYVQKLQMFITEEGLSSRDHEKIGNWVQKQQVLYVRIYIDNTCVFDSAYSDQEIWEKEITAEDRARIGYYEIAFSDGTAELLVFGTYENQLCNNALAIEICICFLGFISIFYSLFRQQRFSGC